MARRSFIRTFGTLGALALPVLCAVPCRAQMHKVEAPQQVTRAVGVYEWTGTLAKPTAARVIPVSLFIDGHFEDAGVYLARPIPFAIQTGDVYSIEKAGRSLGTLDIAFARDVVTRRSASDEDATGVWYGYGRFVPPPAVVAAKTNLHPSAHPATIVASNEDSDDTPHFVTRQPSNAGAAKTSDGPGASTPSSTGTSPGTPAPEDDPERPTLRHRDPESDSKRQKSSRNEGFVTPPNNSLNDDPDRPTLRRGVPADESMPTQLSGMPPDLHQSVAVSDAASREAHIFQREWATATERAETLAGLELAARPRISNYLLTNKLTSSAAPHSGPTPASPIAHASSRSQTAAKSAATRSGTATHRARSTAAAAPGLTLTNEELEGYTLSYGGLPTFVYTVETPVTEGGPVYLTLVAQRLPAGELQVALSSITDATHMDRTPWMRPIDVVDADASHRASLLFELRGQNSRQFALYRLVTAQAEQIFSTGLIQ